MTDPRTFPLDHAPEAAELDRLRAEFVQYQFRFHAFSDHYAVVARFAWEKAQEAVAAAIADRSPEGGDAVGGSVHESGGAGTAIAHPSATLSGENTSAT